MENAPTREEFQALQKSHQTLLETVAITASADLALIISVIGHLAAHATNRNANIESIGQQALKLLSSINEDPVIPQHYKTGMADRIQEIIQKAQKQYGA